MKIATWNVNSLRTREDLVLDWVEREDPDILCMQETKVTDQEFPEDAFGDLDYDVTFYGQRSYNGVAIASHEPLKAIVHGFPTDQEDSQRRLAAATIGDLRIIDIYLPNGQTYGSEKYAYKLDWMTIFESLLRIELEKFPNLILTGDFNIAPRDVDIHDPHDLTDKSIFVSTEERVAFQRLLALGLTDVFLHLHPDQEKPYTFWDYRGGSWERNRGMRIDHFLVTPSVLERVKGITIHRSMRAEEGPSDHVPVVLEL